MRTLTLNSMGRDCCNQLSEEREIAVSERDTPITTPVYQHFSKDKWIGLPALLDFYSCGNQHRTLPIMNINCLTILIILLNYLLSLSVIKLSFFFLINVHSETSLNQKENHNIYIKLHQVIIKF